jgi:hypothetical protein
VFRSIVGILFVYNGFSETRNKTIVTKTWYDDGTVLRKRTALCPAAATTTKHSVLHVARTVLGEYANDPLKEWQFQFRRRWGIIQNREIALQ